MFSRRIQQRVRQIVTMIVRPLAGLGITPNTLTVIGLILSILTAVVLAKGFFLVGGLLVLFAGIFDMFDGAMARVRNASTTFGAFFDSTLDRYSECIILFGLLFFALQKPVIQEQVWPFQYEQSWMIILVFVATVGSFMVSYAKARAEGLGLECRTGLLARPERVVILALGLLTGTVFWALLILAIFSNVTAIERVIHVWRAARQSVALTGVSNFSSDGHMSKTNKSSMHQQLPIRASEGKEPSVPSVHTTVPPFNGGVDQD